MSLVKNRKRLQSFFILIIQDANNEIISLKGCFLSLNQILSILLINDY